jgi:CRP-like cAMP-binding protein
MNREDMGSMLGLTMETVSRIIAEYKRSGILRKGADSCYECDSAALQQIIDS